MQIKRIRIILKNHSTKSVSSFFEALLELLLFLLSELLGLAELPEDVAFCVSLSVGSVASVGMIPV